jgi:hypothetical protein
MTIERFSDGEVDYLIAEPFVETVDPIVRVRPLSRGRRTVEHITRLPFSDINELGKPIAAITCDTCQTKRYLEVTRNKAFFKDKGDLSIVTVEYEDGSKTIILTRKMPSKVPKFLQKIRASLSEPKRPYSVFYQCNRRVVISHVPSPKGHTEAGYPSSYIVERLSGDDQTTYDYVKQFSYRIIAREEFRKFEGEGLHDQEEY